MSRADRPGVTLPELILVAWLFSLVLLGVARFAGAEGRMAATSQDQARVAEALRTVDLVLGAELRNATPADLSVTAASIRLRAVRGMGSICGREGDGVRVRYRGVRRPDPEKDSVLVITRDGTTGTAYPLEAVVADEGCGGGYRLTVGSSASAGLVLVFESGSYHLTGGALRYRRGRGGRQPLTEAVFGESRFVSRVGVLEAHLEIDPDSLPRVPDRSFSLAVALRNGGLP